MIRSGIPVIRSASSSDDVLMPPALLPGDTIAVLSPAGPVDRRFLLLGEQYLEKRGYVVQRGRHSLQRRGYLAGSDGQRLQDLNRAFADPRVNAIFFSRGGYGTTRLLPGIDPAPLLEHPKIILGFSDLTVLLNHLNRAIGLVTFLGPMVASDMSSGLRGQTLRSFHNLLEADGNGQVLLRSIPGKSASGARRGFLRPGKVTARLAGGCLSMIVASLGTGYQPSLEGKILFIEEVNEPAYRIDRMLTQLRHAGQLDRIAGLIIGRLHRCGTQSPEGGRGIGRFLAGVLGPLPCPVFFGFPSGHGRGKVILPVGLPVTMDSAQGVVFFHRPNSGQRV